MFLFNKLRFWWYSGSETRDVVWQSWSGSFEYKIVKLGKSRNQNWASLNKQLLRWRLSIYKLGFWRRKEVWFFLWRKVRSVQHYWRNSGQESNSLVIIDFGVVVVKSRFLCQEILAVVTKFRFRFDKSWFLWTHWGSFLVIIHLELFWSNRGSCVKNSWLWWRNFGCVLTNCSTFEQIELLFWKCMILFWQLMVLLTELRWKESCHVESVLLPYTSWCGFSFDILLCWYSTNSVLLKKWGLFLNTQRFFFLEWAFCRRNNVWLAGMMLLLEIGLLIKEFVFLNFGFVKFKGKLCLLFGTTELRVWKQFVPCTTNIASHQEMEARNRYLCGKMFVWRNSAFFQAIRSQNDLLWPISCTSSQSHKSTLFWWRPLVIICLIFFLSLVCVTDSFVVSLVAVTIN